MNAYRTLLFCLITIILSACVSVTDTTSVQFSTRTAITSPIVAAASPTATIIQAAPTRRPEIDPAMMATQAMATVEASQIVWSGSISPLVFQQLLSEESENREAFKVPESEKVFSLSTQPNIIAAYIYDVSSEEQRHARFLLYEPGGKWRDENIPPFLYKMDLPLSWIGGHEDYGNYNELIRNLEAQLEHPISPNKLRIGVFCAKQCTDAEEVEQQLCAELDRQGIELPIDYETAESMVMDQWDLAIQRTGTQVGHIEQVVQQLNAAGTAWWEDERFVLFYLPYITVCIPDADRPLCGTYIAYNMLIDAFGLLR